MLRIAMIGQRGVPATFGGVEHHAEQLGSRLAGMGHEVTVFCRKNYIEDEMSVYKGMQLGTSPRIGTKHLDAIVHSGLSTLDAMRDDFDVIHYHALGPGAVAPLPRFLVPQQGRPDHPRPRRRAGQMGKASPAMLRGAGWLSAASPRPPSPCPRLSPTTTPTATAGGRTTSPTVGRPAVHGGERDHRAVRGWRSKWRLPARRARPCPASRPPAPRPAVPAAQLALRPDAHGLARRRPRVIMPGYVYGSTLSELYTNAAGFVLPSYLEGLPLTLLEAASYGLPLVASAIPPHLEVLEEAGPGRRVFLPGDEDALITRCGSPSGASTPTGRPPPSSARASASGTTGTSPPRRPSGSTSRPSAPSASPAGAVARRQIA